MSDVMFSLAERTIIFSLPNTYSGLCLKHAPEMSDREIDRMLQRLRKKGLASFVRKGRLTIWSATDACAKAIIADAEAEYALRKKLIEDFLTKLDGTQ